MNNSTLIFLGTGTSTGVPQIRCSCPVCTSTDPRDKRLRASVLLQLDNKKNLLIDCGPDFREQILRLGSPDIDAVLLTHSHYDHVGGMDDLRPYCYEHSGLDVFCSPDVAYDLRTRMTYCFNALHPDRVPTFKIHELQDIPFRICGHTIQPLKVMHGELPILGYRIGDFAYITDCKTMPQDTLELLKGVRTLVINALRIKDHPTHMNLSDALDVINNVKPHKAYLTHLSHDMGSHEEVSQKLPQGVEIAVDGMSIKI